MRARFFIALVVVGVGVGGFLVGRDSARSKPVTGPQSYKAGFLAGHEAAFCCYDGGWGYDEPYIVTLRRGSLGITYRIARRWPILRGLEYRACGHSICAGTGGQADHPLP